MSTNDNTSPAEETRYSIFLSYSRKDAGIARLLIREIERLGQHVKVFIDERGIEGGDPIKETIRQNIHDCDELLVLLSANSVKSIWVSIEVPAAWALQRRIVAVVYGVTPQQGLPIIADMEAIKLEEFQGYLTQLARRAEGKQR